MVPAVRPGRAHELRPLRRLPGHPGPTDAGHIHLLPGCPGRGHGAPPNQPASKVAHGSERQPKRPIGHSRPALAGLPGHWSIREWLLAERATQCLREFPPVCGTTVPSEGGHADPLIPGRWSLPGAFTWIHTSDFELRRFL